MQDMTFKELFDAFVESVRVGDEKARLTFLAEMQRRAQAPEEPLPLFEVAQ